MCRSIAEGGRRCPAHSNPERIKAYNAIRRARYAAQKATTAATIQTSTLVNKETEFSERDNRFRRFLEKVTEKQTQKTKNVDDVYTTTDNITENKTLGITVTENTGYLVDEKYFKANTIKGVIRYDELTDESYKEFGFSEIKENEAYITAVDKDTISLKTMREYSDAELEEHTNIEKKALGWFTTDDYSWFNRILYNNDVEYLNNLTKLDNEEEDDGWMEPRTSSFFDDPNDNFEETGGIIASILPKRSQKFMEQATSILDTALSKGPKHQRIVYRGVSAYGNSLFNEGSGTQKEKLQKFVDENYQVGKEVVFDGYQSSTPSFDAAADYTGGDGLMYEILTPEGVNVTQVSAYDNEKEVILPRASRYMVVGVHKNVQCHDNPNETMNVVQLVAINSKGEVLDGTNSDTPPPVKF